MSHNTIEVVLSTELGPLRYLMEDETSVVVMSTDGQRFRGQPVDFYARLTAVECGPDGSGWEPVFAEGGLRSRFKARQDVVISAFTEVARDEWLDYMDGPLGHEWLNLALLNGLGNRRSDAHDALEREPFNPANVRALHAAEQEEHDVLAAVWGV